MERRYERLIVTRNTAQKLIRFFSACYRQGVNDAYSVNDEGLCRLHIENCKEAGYFGRVGDDVSHDYQYWQIKLMEIARANNMYESIYRYFRNMGKYGRNYLSVSIKIAQCFYNFGLSDYTKYPLDDLTEFNAGSLHKRLRERGTVHEDVRDIVMKVQDLCYKLRYADMNTTSRFALKEQYYKMFIKVISLALSKGLEWDD